jgi:CubicO group peptidase (beta-lactamase class C family)
MHMLRFHQSMLALLVCLALPALFATAQVPDTLAGQQLTAWLNAFNSGRDAELAEFMQQRFTATTRTPGRDNQERLQVWSDMRQRAGAFELQSIEQATNTRLTALLKSRDEADRYWRIALAVQSQSATLVLFELGPAPPTQAPTQTASSTRLTQAQAIAALQTELDKESAAGRFSGAVLIAKDGKAIFQQAYGAADRDRQIPNTVATLFRIGSMNKMFTAVAAVQLAQAGKLKFADPLGKYLPGYPDQEVAKVTIHQLLTHTGGTGDFFGPDFDSNRQKLKTHQDYLTAFGNKGLAFAPGTRWEYSNYGYVLLGRIIEVVSKQSYYDYVREHIFKPAGMTASDSLPEDQQVKGRAVGYTTLDSGVLQSTAGMLPYRGTAAGGGYSTVNDLLSFANALNTNKLLNAQYTELLTSGKIKTQKGSYAYGFEDLATKDGLRTIGNSGGSQGQNGELIVFPASGYAIVVLANIDPPAALRIASFIAARLLAL